MLLYSRLVHRMVIFKENRRHVYAQIFYSQEITWLLAVMKYEDLRMFTKPIPFSLGNVYHIAYIKKIQFP